jgi:hypothetical protein
MALDSICDKTKKIRLLLEGELNEEDRDSLRQHILECDDCLTGYILLKTGISEEDWLESDKDSIFNESEQGCPTPDMMYLLIEGQLEEEKRAEILKHIKNCKDCAAEYEFLQALQKTDASGETEKVATKKEKITEKRDTRIIPFWNYLYLQKVATILLLLGFGYWSGVRFPYSGGGEEQDPGSPSGLPYRSAASFSATDIEKSPLYQDAMNNVIWDEIRSNLPGGSDSSLPDRAPFHEETHLWENIEKKKRDFDERLSTVLKVSGVAADIALADYGVDLLSLTSENLSVFARLLKEGREMDINYAREWISLDQNLYFSLAEKIPQDVWDRYTPDKRSFKIFSWIASLPPAEREKMWKLTGEQAEKEFLEQRNK